jgi:glycosyltransferase involved in cell wall biosynthesis
MTEHQTKAHRKSDPRRRRILLVSHEATLSGAPIQLVHLAGWLLKRGWEIAIVAPEDGPVLNRVRGGALELIFEPQLLIDPTYSALRRLAREFDLVMANTIATWEAVQAAHLEQTPVVWYLHETEVGVDLMKEIHMIQPSLGLANALIVPTRTTARIYQPFTRRPIHVVPYGIPEVRPAATRPSAPRMAFVTTATYESRKGQDVFLEAIRQLDSETRARAWFEMAGRPLETAFHDQLCAGSREFDNVRLQGPLDHEQSIDLLRQADVVVCPSRDETMPIFLLEGMSLGKTLISTDVGGVTEWLHDGQNALIVPSRDPAALSVAIARCINDRELVRELAAEARETFVRYFTLEALGEHVEAILEQTIEPRECPAQPGTYGEWAHLYETPRRADRVALRHAIEALRQRPLISILLPIYNPNFGWLSEAIDSVQRQIYGNWELCLADDASTDDRVRAFLEERAASDKRIKVVFRENNGHISACSNSALALATGEWCALLDQDDTLAEHALALVVCELAEHPDAGLIYSDEDKIDLAGTRSNPFFKTDWNPELFLGQNYINHLGSYRTSLLRFIGGFREGLEGSQDYDLALRCIERLQAHQIRHIPRILYHWRMVPGSLAEVRDAKPYAKEAARLALNDHLRRAGIAGRAEPCPENIESHRVIYKPPEPRPRIVVIISAKNQSTWLPHCVESVRRYLDSRDEIIIVIDAGVDADFGLLGERGVTVLRDDFAANRGRMNNLAAARATADILLFVDAGVEATSSEGLDEMISQVSRLEVGVVGARLWSAEGILRQGGFILGLGGIAASAHAGIPRGHPGFFNRAFLQRNCAAVSSDCCAVRTEVFRELGGFDDQHFAGNLQDVDFCLRAWDCGLQVVWTPYADLVLRSRSDSAPPITQDADYLWRRWVQRLNEDPFYSPSLSLALPGFELAFPPRWLHARK